MMNVDVQRAINLDMPSWEVADAPYRFALGRRLTPARGINDLAVWVMLNPSMADGLRDDPTIRKVRKFTAKLGVERFVVVNLYAFRATKPRDLSKAYDAGNDVVGETWNTIAIGDALAAAKYVVVAWGANKGPMHVGRVAEVLRQIERRGHKPLCLGRTDDNSPRHPLMLSYETAFEAYA